MWQLPPAEMLRRMAVAVLAVLVVLLFAEILTRVVIGWSHPPQSHSAQFDQKRYLARLPVKNNLKTVFFLGDSQMKYGVYPEAFLRVLHQSGMTYNAQNLATDSATPELNLFLLETAIEAGANPGLVVLNVSPVTFSQLHQQQPALNALEKFSESYVGRCVYQLSHNPASKLRCALEEHSMLFRHRGYFRQQLRPVLQPVLNPLQALQKYRLEAMAGVVETEFSPNGWAPGYGVFTQKQFEEKFASPMPVSAEIKSLLENYHYEWSDASLKELAAFCKEKNIPLLLVWLPRHPAWFTAYGFLNVDSQTESHIARRITALQDWENVWVLDLHTRDADSTHYYDPNHANVSGALHHTQMLAKEMLIPPYRKLLQP